MKKKKQIKFNFKNVFVFITTIIATFVLGYDFLVWGVIPAFNKEFIQLTYFGMFVDLIAIFVLEMNSQIIREWK